MDIDKIISIIRNLKEDGGMVGNAPGAQGAFGASSDPKGPAAGNTYPIGKPQRRNNPIFLGKGSRKNWLDFLGLPKKSK